MINFREQGNYLFIDIDGIGEVGMLKNAIFISKEDSLYNVSVGGELYLDSGARDFSEFGLNGTQFSSANNFEIWFGNLNANYIVIGSSHVHTNLPILEQIEYATLNTDVANWNAKQNALGFTPENIANKGMINGYAPLDSNTLIPSVYLPSYVDDVLEFANLASFPITGVPGKIYIAIDTNLQYRWSGSMYIEITDKTATWGQISGTISNQTDLQNALNLKENSINKTTAIVGNETSNTLFATVKAVFDWVTLIFVPKTRTITINGNTQNLSSNISYTITSGISEAPNDANAYVRSALGWMIGYTKTAIDGLLALKENIANKVNTIVGQETNSTQYPNNKALADYISYLFRKNQYTLSLPLTGGIDTYVLGSNINISGAKTGSTYRCLLNVSKTGAGTTAPTFQFRIGTNGTLSDSSFANIGGAGQTANATVAQIEFNVLFLSPTQVFVGLNYHNSIASSGISSVAGAYRQVTSGSFSVGATTQFGISLDSGTASAWTALGISSQFNL